MDYQGDHRPARRRRFVWFGAVAAAGVTTVLAATLASAVVDDSASADTVAGTPTASSAAPADAHVHDVVATGPSRASVPATGQVIPTTPVGPTTTQRTPSKVANTTGVDGVIAYNTDGYPGTGSPTTGTVEHQHVTGPVKYAVVPPVGGPHNGTWMNAGTYTSPIPPERAVHNLEHGAVWITYSPTVSQTTINALYAFVHKQKVLAEGRLQAGGPVQGNRYIDLSPWPSDSLGAPIVISSWGYQLKLQKVDDPRLQQFVDTFRKNSKYSPESNAPVDGVKVSIGGRAARDGALYANPD